MDDTTVVVTGGTDGIGRAVVEMFADAGARVVVGARDADEVDAIADELGTNVTGLRADVRDEFDVERLVETAARFGPGGIDVVVPCVRTSHGTPGDTPLPAESYAAFDDTVRTNARGVFVTIKEALAHMPSDGRVVVPIDGRATDLAPSDDDNQPNALGSYGVSEAATWALIRGFATDCEQIVGAVNPEVATIGDSEDDRGFADAASLIHWTVTALSPDDLDGAVVSAQDWESARAEQ